MEIDQQIQILNLRKAGAVIEARPRGEGQWRFFSGDTFDFVHYEYREKPRPPREFWALDSGKGGDMWVYSSHGTAVEVAANHGCPLIHLREVL